MDATTSPSSQGDTPTNDAWGQKPLPLGPMKKVHVYWLAGMSCDGCSISVTGATNPGIEGLLAGTVPFGTDMFKERDGTALLVKKQVILTGERINDAQPGFDNLTNKPAVHLNLDGVGARRFKDATRENVGKRMAIILFEKGRGEIITAPVIQEEIGGGRVQITGQMSAMEAQDTALLLRAGALAAPMEIIEERTVGPSLGADNIKRGFDSTKIGFILVAIFMIAYYLMFGVISVLALGANLLLLVALLSMMQATLTLPGMAGIALTLGMAIDANPLIGPDPNMNSATPAIRVVTLESRMVPKARSYPA